MHNNNVSGCAQLQCGIKPDDSSTCKYQMQLIFNTVYLNITVHSENSRNKSYIDGISDMKQFGNTLERCGFGIVKFRSNKFRFDVTLICLRLL